MGIGGAEARYLRQWPQNASSGQPWCALSVLEETRVYVTATSAIAGIGRGFRPVRIAYVIGLWSLEVRCTARSSRRCSRRLREEFHCGAVARIQALPYAILVLQCEHHVIRSGLGQQIIQLPLGTIVIDILRAVGKRRRIDIVAVIRLILRLILSPLVISVIRACTRQRDVQGCSAQAGLVLVVCELMRQRGCAYPCSWLARATCKCPKDRARARRFCTPI